MLNHDLSFLLDGPSPADADDSWVQIAKTGKYQDPRYGKFTITAQDFSRWIRNFSASVGHGELGLPVDVDHSPEKRGDTEAFGWVKQLEQRGDEMWAKVDWNDQGRALIADRRYAYISPSYSPNFKDESGEAHGTALVGIALTNRPFLKMATVNLSGYQFARSDNSGGDDTGLNPDDTTDLMGPTPDTGEEGVALPEGYTSDHALDDLMLDISDAARQKHAVVVKKIGGKTRHMFPIPPGDAGHARAALRLLPRAIKAGHITSTEAAAIRARASSVLGKSKSSSTQLSTSNNSNSNTGWVTIDNKTWPFGAEYSLQGMTLDETLTAIGLSRSDLGVAADADDTTVLTALKAHKNSTPEGSVTLSKDEVTTLLADASAGRAASEELRLAKFENSFTLAQSEGKVVPAQKETYLALYNADGEHTLKLLSELQPTVVMTPQGSGQPVGDFDPQVATLASQYQDTAADERYSIDTEGLKILAKAEEIERERKIPFEEALKLAESGATV